MKIKIPKSTPEMREYWRVMQRIHRAKLNSEELRYTQEVFLSGRIAEINHLIEVVKT